MIDIEFDSSIDTLASDLSGAIDKAWGEVVSVGEIRDQVRSLAREVLLTKMKGWVPSRDVVNLYPFFRNVQSFVNRYARCFSVKVEGKSVEVLLEPSLLISEGLPTNIGELLEFGNTQLPQFTHFDKVISLWQTRYADRLLGGLADLVVL